MRVALIRHLAPDIPPGLCYGRMDVGLAPQARSEIARYAADPLLRGATRVWSSPARRCRIMADAIARHLDVECTTDERLLELDFGAWEGRAWNDIPRTSLDEWAAMGDAFAPPGGESGSALIRRVTGFFAALRKAGQDCAVVSHGGPLKILLGLFNGQPIDLFRPPPPIGSLTEVHLPD
jgi:alpha-ribazole phosphatase